MRTYHQSELDFRARMLLGTLSNKEDSSLSDEERVHTNCRIHFTNNGQRHF